MSRAVTILCGLLVAATTGCPGSDVRTRFATEVVVAVDSDLGPELVAIDAQVFDAEGTKPGGSHTFALGADLTLPISFAVVPATGRSTGRFLVAVSGKDARGEVLVENSAYASFVSGKTVALELWLLKACRGVVCTAHQTCGVAGSVAGSCSPIPIATTREAKPGSELETGPGPRLQPPTDDTDAGMGGLQGDAGGLGGDGGSPGRIVSGFAPAFSTSGGPRYGGAPGEPGRLLLLDDGYETGETICDGRGFCATSSFLP